MKSFAFLFISGLLVLFAASDAATQQVIVQEFEWGGFGYVEFDRKTPCLEEKDREEKLNELLQIRDSMIADGRLSPFTSEHVELTSPVRPGTGYDGFSLKGISNYVDHNLEFPDQLQDFNCGTRTYDLPNGYNHRGIDYFTWPFAWYHMDYENHEVVAAAPGVILTKIDGNFDRNCSFNSGQWNAVYLTHADGSISWYGHMKNGSLTSKNVGDSVERGEFLGIVGSSGSSTAPHLHFEVYDGGGQLIDPYAGPCNNMNANSWWSVQAPYYDSAINKLTSHFAPPDFPTCPQTEIRNIADEFEPGDLIFVAVYYRDQLRDEVTNFRLLRPDGSIRFQWNSALTSADHFQASYWFWQFQSNIAEMQGEYTFEAVFRGETYTHNFFLGSPPVSVETPGELPNIYELGLPYPNPFNPTTNFELSLEQPQNVLIEVVSLTGQRVAILNNSPLSAGNSYSFTFDAQNFASGIYLIRVKGEHFADVRKISLVK